MRKSAFIAAVALFVAAAGVIIALAAYFKNNSNYLYEDEDDFLFDDPDDLEYYTSDLDGDEADDPDEDSVADLRREDGVEEYAPEE